MVEDSAEERVRPDPSVPPPLPTGRVAGPSMFCAACGRSMPQSAVACPWCHAVVASGELGNDPLLRMVLPVGRSGLAIAAGYLGLFAVLFFPAPFALAVGLLAIRDIRRHPEKHGMGRAIFGALMGGLFTVLLVGLIILGIVASVNRRLA